MPQAPVRINDPVACDLHGDGHVITPDATVTFEGQLVARAGDTVKYKDTIKKSIEEGNACVMVNGQRLALVGDKAENKGTLKDGASTILVDEGDPFVFIGPNVHVGQNVSFLARNITTDKWKSIKTIPPDIRAALKEAMQREGVPEDQYNSLAWIMAQESSGQVNVKNSHSSARGLYQLTRANYHLNPNGESSFGNPVEEAQGGIRYINERYGSADKAVTFWKQHQWY